MEVLALAYQILVLLENINIWSKIHVRYEYFSLVRYLYTVVCTSLGLAFKQKSWSGLHYNTITGFSLGHVNK